jgi:hypothetical protein
MDEIEILKARSKVFEKTLDVYLSDVGIGTDNLGLIWSILYLANRIGASIDRLSNVLDKNK